MNNCAKIVDVVGSRLLQYGISIGGGLLAAFEASIPFFVPCLIATIIDVIAAYCLARRVHKRHPERSDGKFKSEYKYRIMFTMIIALAAIMLAHYVDLYVIKESDLAVRWIMGFFLFYQCWSILENWSSENNNKLARALQRIMVNKAERHLNVPLSDIMLNDKSEGNDGADNI